MAKALGRPFSLFELLGNRQNIEAVKGRYETALSFLREETRGIFTTRNGYSLKRFHLWTDAQKRKIRRYYNDIKALQSYGVRIKTSAPKDSKKNRKAQKASQHLKVIKGLKHLYVPGHEKYKPKIKFSKSGTPYRSDQYFDIFAVEFRQQALATEDEDEIFEECIRVWNTLMKQGGKRKLEFVSLMTGEYESLTIGKRIKNADDLFREVLRIQERYAGQNHLWLNWLRGILGYFRKPGSKIAQTLGSRSAIHYNDLEEKRTLRRKLIKADPEARSMFQRREARELSAAKELADLMRQLESLENLQKSMLESGIVFDDIKTMKEKLLKRIQALKDKVTARETFNRKK